VAPYSPIARGVLTGKYRPAPPEPGTRAGRADKRMAETEPPGIAADRADNWPHAQARGVSLAQFATAWVLANRIVSSVIAGPRTLAQWQDYFAALDYVVTAEDEALVDSFVVPRPPVHTRLYRSRLPAHRQADPTVKIFYGWRMAGAACGIQFMLSGAAEPGLRRLCRGVVR
jgi:hypothetical protein